VADYKCLNRDKDDLLVREKRRIYDLKERVFLFASRTLDIAEILPSNSTCNVIRIQH
jgi:hypothetical protein